MQLEPHLYRILAFAFKHKERQLLVLSEDSMRFSLSPLCSLVRFHSLPFSSLSFLLSSFSSLSFSFSSALLVSLSSFLLFSFLIFSFCVDIQNSVAVALAVLLEMYHKSKGKKAF